MAVGPIHALGPASRFRPRFARLIAEGEEVTVSPLSVDSVAALGEPATDATTPNVGRGPIHIRRPLSRFRPRVLGAPTMPPPAVEGTVEAGSVASVAAIGSPQVISTVSDGYVASRSITRPVSRFRPRIERVAHFAELTGQTIFPSSVASVAAVGDPAVTQEYSLDGGGTLPEGWTIGSGSVDSVASVSSPTVTDSGATILAGSVVSQTLFGSPFVFSGAQIRTSSVDSVAEVGTPEITVVETTILASSVSSGAAVGNPFVDDGIGSWLGPAGRSSSTKRGSRKYLVQAEGRDYYFATEREAQEFIEWRKSQEPPEQPKKRRKKKPLEVVKLEAPEPPKPPTPEELAAQERQREVEAVKAQYEQLIAEIQRQKDSEIAFLTASANLLKQDNEALRVLIEG